MKWPFFLCLMLGSLVVFQPMINRMILEQRGLAFAIFMNGTLLFFITSLLFLFAYWQGENFPPLLRLVSPLSFQWWYFLPGLMGFCLVVSVPLMMRFQGGFATVVLMLLGQVLTSLTWDFIVNDIVITKARLAGLTLAFAGAYLSFKPEAP